MKKLLRKTYVKAMTAAAVLTLSTTLTFPAMAAQNNCFTGRNTVIVMGNGKNQLSGNCNFGIMNIPGFTNPGSGNTGNTGNSGSSGSVNDSTSNSTYVTQILNLVNEERAKSGLSPLTLDTAASKAAQTRAQEITSRFSHTRPGGKDFATALTEAGVAFRSAGENIASGQTTPVQVMNSWMNSSGHRANILSKNYTKIGIAHYKDASGTDYWVQLFFN